MNKFADGYNYSLLVSIFLFLKDSAQTNNICLCKSEPSKVLFLTVCSISYQLLDIRIHNQLSIEQTYYVFYINWLWIMISIVIGSLHYML